jgi:HEAT repeat protein
MTPGLALRLGLLLLVAACDGQPPGTPLAKGPTLPPLQLRPFLAELKAIAAAMPPPAEAVQRELRDLSDLALQLVEADVRTAGRAERSLREHGDAWWVLEPALAHERPEVRRRAAWLCGQSGQTVLQLPLLLRLKYETDAETNVWVADALLRLGNDHGLGWLDAAIAVATTQDHAGGLAVDALRARAVPLAEQPTWADVRAALQAGHRRFLATGTPSLPNVLAPTPTALDARIAVHLITTEGTLLRPVDDARFVLTRAGTLAVPLLARTLVASEPYLRTMALQVLADLGPAARGEAAAVIPLLGDPLTGSYAVRTLGEIGAQDAIPHLRPLLHHPDTELRAAAVQALGLLRDEPSREPLRTRLLDANEAMDVRIGAAFGLLCFAADDAAAVAFLAEREQKKDYHEPTLTRLRERLAVLRR